MEMQMNRSGKLSDQNILFMIDKDSKKVHMEVSSNKEPVAILRKHWRGDDENTRLIFSKENQNAEPVMWVWRAGYMTRENAKAFLLEWERIFAAEGYEIIGSNISKNYKDNAPALTRDEKRILSKVSVSKLLSCEICHMIQCSPDGGDRLPASQKFSTRTEKETLRVQVDPVISDNFWKFCREKGLTGNQGLMLLMADYTGKSDLLLDDLQSRLEKANAELQEHKQKISSLQDDLKRSEENKDYPKKIRTAELQGHLLKEFFKALPVIDCPPERILWRYSYCEGTRVFPEAREYSFPTEEGIVHMCVEHIQHSRGHPSCLFLFGKDEMGNKIKIRWYSVKGNDFGDNIKNSQYLWYNAPWIFAVQRDGEAMEMVGSLPNLGEIWKTWNVPKEDVEKETAGYVETEEDDDSLRALIGEELYNEFRGWIRESEELARMYEIGEHEEKTITQLKESERDVLLDKSSTLDEKIRAASNKR